MKGQPWKDEINKATTVTSLFLLFLVILVILVITEMNAFERQAGYKCQPAILFIQDAGCEPLEVTR